MRHPTIGERVFVRPTNPALRVQRSAQAYGKFIPPEGMELVWDEFLHARYRDGSITWEPLESAEPADDEKELA